MAITAEPDVVAPGLHLSLSDVAHLARVQRPVVSMWRSRAAASDLPFPKALDGVGAERFDVAAVVDWLEASGRGNNPDVRADAAAYALPAGISLRDDPAVFAGLTALLCLKVVSGADLSGLSASALHELAAEADPHDKLLRRELNELGSRLPTMAGYVDHLADAAFGSAQAFEGLMAQRFRHGLTDAVRSAVAAPVHALVTALALALARDCGAEPPTYVDPTGAGSDLFLSVVRADVDHAPDVVAPDDDTPPARLFRRRLRVHDLRAEASAVASVGSAVLVAHFPPNGRPDVTDDEILAAIDELAVAMNDRQRAVVVAPASLLIDRMGERARHQRRSHVLRAGRVRAMVRLPAGLVIHRSRQPLALWVLGPDFEQHALDERRVAVIDVSDEPLTELLIAQIRDDVVSAMAGPRLSRSHSYARARLVQTSTLLAQSGSLLPPRSAVTRADLDPAAASLRIEHLRTDPRQPQDALDGARVEVGDPPAPTSISVREAIRRKVVRVLSGNRAGFDLDEDGNVCVIGVPELTSTNVVGSRRVDRLTFLGTHDVARLTEAGDVVYCTSPRPCAVVDEVGGSAVQYPARVLRVDPVRGEGLSPHVIAHAINAQPASSRAWHSWSLPRVPAEQMVVVAAALSGLHREQAAASARLLDLDHLERTVVQGVTSGSLLLRPTTSTPHPDDKDD